MASDDRCGRKASRPHPRRGDADLDGSVRVRSPTLRDSPKLVRDAEPRDDAATIRCQPPRTLLYLSSTPEL